MELTNDWQNIDDILQSNRIMLEKQFACDVTFLLGKDDASFGAHKYILISRSPVFSAMFCGTLSDGSLSSEIAVPDVELEDFRTFLQYLYTGTTEINADNVMPLLYVSKKYAVTGLSNKCIAFVENYLDAENSCAVLEQAHFFDERDFHEKVLRVILRKGEEVLETDDVTELCEECFGKIIGSDDLMAKEDFVLKASIRWSKSQCSKQDLAVTDSNCRIMLGSILYKIRFPLLDPAVFVQQIASGNLLTEEEKVDVMGRYILPSRPSSHFPTSIRIKNRHLRFNRFPKRNEAAFNNKSGSSAINFETNQDICIEGFTVYGTCRAGNHELQVNGRIIDSTETVICSVEKAIVTSGDSDIYDIMLDNSYRLHAGTRYTLVVDIIGSHTFAGKEGRTAAFAGDTIFSFSPSELSQTGTTVTHGQLPGVIFSP